MLSPATRRTLEANDTVRLDELEAFSREWEDADARRRASEFKVRFAPEAIALRNELSHRTGIPTGGADDPTRAALEDGRIDETTIKALRRALHGMAERLPA